MFKKYFFYYKNSRLYSLKEISYFLGILLINCDFNNYIIVQKKMVIFNLFVFRNRIIFFLLAY